jgi:hypothetical protein
VVGIKVVLVQKAGSLDTAVFKISAGNAIFLGPRADWITTSTEKESDKNVEGSYSCKGVNKAEIRADDGITTEVDSVIGPPVPNIMVEQLNKFVAEIA